MHFAVDPKSATPIYEQIIAQFIYFIASGAIRPGESIPSVRELHDELTVNPNTVAKAYTKLSEQGILRTKRGLGMEVTEEAPSICKAQRQEMVRQRVREALREAVASALSAEEVDRLVAEELHRVNGKR